MVGDSWRDTFLVNSSEEGLLEMSSKASKCKRFREAFTYDEIFTEKLFKSWLLDQRYGALVNVRLLQLYRWKSDFLLSRYKLLKRKILYDEKKKIGRIIAVILHPNLLLLFVLYKIYGYVYIFYERILLSFYNMDISPYADIGKGFWGVMRNIGITAGAKIGDNVNFSVGVSIASHQGMAPIIEDDVTIWVGAVIVGGVRVGRGAIIGANSVVVTDVPPNCTVVGNPAKIIFRK